MFIEFLIFHDQKICLQRLGSANGIRSRRDDKKFFTRRKVECNGYFRGRIAVTLSEDANCGKVAFLLSSSVDRSRTLSFGTQGPWSRYVTSDLVTTLVRLRRLNDRNLPQSRRQAMAPEQPQQQHQQLQAPEIPRQRRRLCRGLNRRR